jgi:hypothetical protein
MTSKRNLSLAITGALFLLASCGGHDGVELGPFAALSATEGDAPITLSAPTSKSPAAFTYTSSNPRVGEIRGNTIVIGIEGTATITAQQGREGSYYPTSTSTTLTVAKRVCELPAENVDGVCVVTVNTAANLSSGGLDWMPATERTMTWATADAFCKTAKINESTGWRLPTQAELNSLVATGQLTGKGWNLADTWTSNAGTPEKTHVAINLSSNRLVEVADDKKAAVTCVK